METLKQELSRLEWRYARAKTAEEANKANSRVTTILIRLKNKC
jgi:hypothetical protein